MNSKFYLIFVCFVINLINVFIVSTMNANLLDSLVYYNDSETRKMSGKDRYHLHHAFVVEANKWKDGRINYRLHEHFDAVEMRKILSAMEEIEMSSCIRFVDHDPSSIGSDYVMIEKEYTETFASSSDLGCRHHGVQYLSLSSITLNARDHHAAILHEILHTIGFDHHHQRSDRDKYIKIHLENTKLDEFDIINNYAKDIRFDRRVKYLTPFDFNSVMLYGEYSDSINGKPVITSKIEGKKLPSTSRRSGLSRYDKILLNRFYNCKPHYGVAGKNETLHENGTESLHRVAGKNETLHENVTESLHRVAGKNETLHENGTDSRNEVVGENETLHKNGTNSRHPVVINYQQTHLVFTNNSAASTKWQRMAVSFLQCAVLLVYSANFGQR